MLPVKNHIIEQELLPLLDRGEELLWTGRPTQGIILRPMDILLIPFSLVWCGFAIFWEASVLQVQAPFLFKLFGLPFVGAGLYIVFGRFFMGARRRKNTLYGITASRVIIKSGLRTTVVKSLNIKSMMDVTIAEKRNGSGTITLETEDRRYALMADMEWPGAGKVPRLQLDEEARDVYNLIVKLQRQ